MDHKSSEEVLELSCRFEYLGHVQGFGHQDSSLEDPTNYSLLRVGSLFENGRLCGSFLCPALFQLIATQHSGSLGQVGSVSRPLPKTRHVLAWWVTSLELKMEKLSS